MPRAKLSNQTVLEAAARLADRDGFDAISVSAVARQLGVRPASLYEHVLNRDAILDGVQQLALSELGTLVGDEIAGRSGTSALGEFVHAHRSYATARPGAWMALQRSASPETARSSEAARVASLTLAVVRGYPVPESDLVHAARLVGATVNGFLALSGSDAFDHRADAPDDSWTATIDALDRALKTWPTERQSV